MECLWKLGRHLPDLSCCNKMPYAGIRRRKGVAIICIVGVDMSSKTYRQKLEKALHQGHPASCRFQAFQIVYSSIFPCHRNPIVPWFTPKLWYSSPLSPKPCFIGLAQQSRVPQRLPIREAAYLRRSCRVDLIPHIFSPLFPLHRLQRFRNSLSHGKNSCECLFCWVGRWRGQTLSITFNLPISLAYNNHCVF